MVGTQRQLIRLSVHAVDNLARAAHGARFQDLPVATAQDQLRAWLGSDVAALRGLVQSLYLFTVMAYTAHPEVAPLLRPWFGCGFGL